MIVRVTPFIIVLVAAGRGRVLSIFSGEAANMFNLPPEYADDGADPRLILLVGVDWRAQRAPPRSRRKAPRRASRRRLRGHRQTPSEAKAQSTPEESQQVNTNAQITVINGTGVSGYANDRAGVLQNQGFTNVSAANPDATTVLPAQTVVYYQNEADLATAQQVANAWVSPPWNNPRRSRTPIQEVVLMQ